MNGPRTSPSSGQTPAPAGGQIEYTVTYLQMTRRPERLDLRPPRADLAVMRAACPTVSFYRYLYHTVGGPWNWRDQRLLSEEALAAIIQDQRSEIHVLYAAGTPAGFAELDRRQPAEIELRYFGLIPVFIGQGLGRYLLAWALDKAWSYAPRRFWVHTCTLDHPRALPNYLRAGFTVYKTEVEQRPSDWLKKV